MKSRGENMNKIAIVAYSGEINNFVDALETALEKVHKGEEVKLIIEGEATHCIKDILNSNSPYRFLYNEIKNSGIIDCICETCSKHNGLDTFAKVEGFQLRGESYGHPSLINYSRNEYELVFY